MQLDEYLVNEKVLIATKENETLSRRPLRLITEAIINIYDPLHYEEILGQTQGLWLNYILIASEYLHYMSNYPSFALLHSLTFE